VTLDELERNPEYAALLAGVLQNPDEDLRRLVLADWLGDRGQEDRAEFIRLQVDAWAVDPDEPEGTWNARSGRIFELLRAHHEWVPDFGPRFRVNVRSGYKVELYDDADETVRVEFRRGLVREVACDLGRWVGTECECGGAVPCEMCRGTGWTDAASSSGGAVRCPHYDPDDEMGGNRCVGPCGLCRGVGRVDDAGRRLVRTQPVESLAFPGVTPYAARFDTVFGWHRDSSVASGVPACLFFLLDGFHEGSGLVKWYRKSDAAVAALQRAALKLARETDYDPTGP